MLQEKASAVTDDSVTGVQSGGPDLSPDSSHLGLPTTPSTPQGNEPDQVIMGIVGSQHRARTTTAKVLYVQKFLILGNGQMGMCPCSQFQ